MRPEPRALQEFVPGGYMTPIGSSVAAEYACYAPLEASAGAGIVAHRTPDFDRWG
jgi:hypothetical protein